ncbi:Ankyrin repeat protein [Lasiodiplodia theobromae]|uniref:Ankyrin repeat protein n=1 Tax=Lasiodiplodia theobromae TaxID=45133 RepID=UPI0015C30DF8|nr:Ankyrin repeat protein [Lasiodiplodia theobromae]KAF4539816.1 Ankyrin repeat protein [Lasiodiplodia theobromae]
MILPARVEEMKRFVDFMINSLIESAGPRAQATGIAGQQTHPEIVENISLRLWGLNFRVAQEWFNRLKLQPTRGGIMENISQIPWRGSSTYRADLNQLQTDETHAEDQAGWRIVSLVMAARRTLKQEDLRTAEAALRLRKLEEKYMDKMDHSRMIFLSKGLITIIQDPNQNVVADPPFYDFFHSPERDSGSQFREAHYNMASACLNYLRLDKLFESSKYDVNKRLWEEPFLAYAACFWGEHVRLAKSKDVDSKARDFLQDHQRFAALLKVAWTCSLPAQASLRWDVNSGLHALHVCAWFGLASLIPMVRGKSSIDELESFYNQTPLIYASRKGHESAVVVLLDAGADPARFSSKGYNALFEAVTVYELSQRDSKIRISKRLLDDGRIDIHATHPGSKHRTALHIAARQGEDCASLVETLISHGADPNRIDDRGWTPIMSAARLGRERIVERLLEAPVDVDLFGSQWNFKTTALHLAVEGGHQEIAVRLLARGAKPWLRDVWGLDVEAKAKRKGLQKLIDLMAEQRTPGSGSPTVDEIQPAPLETHALHEAVSGSDLSATDRWGLRVMDYAIYNRRGFMQVELLDAGAEFDAHRSDDLNFLLSLAYHDEKANAISRLFAKGADEFQAYPLVPPQMLENSNIGALQSHKRSATSGHTDSISTSIASQKTMGYSHDSLKGQGVKRLSPQEDDAQKKRRLV